MDKKEVIKINEYFKKIEHVRGGDFMSEMKRQYVVRLKSKGLRSKQIKQLIHMKHDKIWHYLNKMKPNPQISEFVSANMDEWIDNGLYPLSLYDNKTFKTTCILHGDPTYKTYRKKDKSDEFEELISFLADK